MFSWCENPSELESLTWLSCYLTTNTHFSFYWSFVTVFTLLALTAPLALLFGFGGALAKRSNFTPLKWFGKIYTSMVRGIPDIVFFLFVPIAMDQGLEFIRHKTLCSDVTDPVYQGNDFVVCAAAKLPLSSADAWVHTTYGFLLAVVAYAIVFGAFAANVLDGALGAVPKSQLETASAYGMNKRQIFRRIHLPQMWTYALPGLSNLWMILVKATPLLFLLGVEDIVYWAGALGSSKTVAFYEYPHPDWRLWYFSALLVFYLLLTWASEKFLTRLRGRLSMGQSTLGGKAQAEAAI
ncbi:MAG: ABC transporter permease subunit [Pseudomonadota bacterium]